MAVLLDTSLLVAFERGIADRAAVVEEAAVSVVTVSEFLHSVHRAPSAERRRRQAVVEHYLGELAIVDITGPVARLHAAVWADLAAAGTIIGAHDLWIGATALAHGFGVMTRNARDFARIPGLRVITV